MKKKNIATALALATVLAATPFAVGCSGDHYSKLSFDAQDTTYAVTSQGGSAVSYGNYVYFINGTRGYEDSDGKNNVWDKAIKGGLYRAELLGEKVTGGAHSDFVPATEQGEALGFVYTDGYDPLDEEIKVVTTDKISAKTVGTTGYADGGIFIYDNYVFYASPNNQKDRKGNVQTTLTDFFMMPLNGGSPKKIYTTASGVDPSSSAYAVYKYGKKVYLVVNEGGTIVSIGISEKGKIDDTVKFEVNATGVYFPVRDTYYNGIETDTLEDFIYFVRSATDDDETNTGSVIEMMRPDGSENIKIGMRGRTETLEAVRDGVLFYRTTDNAKNTKIAYTSLHDILMSGDENGDFSPTYKAAQTAKDEYARNLQFDGEFGTTISSDITATYAFRPDSQSNEVMFLGVTSSAINLYKQDGSFTKIFGKTGTVKFVKDGYAYIKDSSDFVRVPLFENMEGFADKEVQTLISGAGAATLECDLAAGYFMYYDTLDQWADNYTYFCKVDGAQNIEDGVVKFESVFVGDRSADYPTEEQIKEAKGEE